MNLLLRAALAATLFAAPAFAQQQMHAQHGSPQSMPAATGGAIFKSGSLVIDTPWTRATPKGAQVAGGFMRITNSGSTPDKLVGGAFPLSKRFEVHQMSIIDGMMKMRPVEGGLVIPPGGTVELKPGSYHVMMIDLSQPIEQGAPIKSTLKFEKAGEVAIEFAVAKVGAAAPDPSPMQQMHQQHQPKQ